MKKRVTLWRFLPLPFAALVMVWSSVFCAGAGELPDKLISKGGVIYPRTGDSGQARFQTPESFRDFLSPGMRIGVLPDDCVEASSGSIGSYYRCDYGLALKADGQDHQGQTVYRVIETP